VRYHYEVHRGADHGYALPDRDVYDKHCANRDWELIFALFHRQLRPYST
jgi:carboxymethylenebutenolidase